MVRIRLLDEDDSMIQKNKITKLLHTGFNNEHFYEELKITDAEDKELKVCRNVIRSSLRRGFNELKNNVNVSNSEQYQYIYKLTPKFWTQGSYVYKTLNNPAHSPPQQIDLDDGVYFPMDVVENSPVAAKKVLLEIIEDILQPLCTVNDWMLIIKSTCFRILVSKRIHIDIPVYAIPQDRYQIMEAKFQNSRTLLDADTFLDEEIYLDPHKIYLAMHNDDEHWKASDPMKLQRWFLDECSIHGRLRRVCRYLKAWRDHIWEKGGPSSITLMVVAAQTFDQHLNDTGKGFQTDCQALLAIAQAMPRQFSSEIINPAEEQDEEVMFPRGNSNEELKEIRAKIQAFKDEVQLALCETENSDTCVKQLRETFGLRIPYRPEWVESIQIGAAIRSLPAKKQEYPKPPKTLKSA